MAIKFKAKEVDNSTERLICTGLIISDTVLAQLAPILQSNMMTARYTSYIVDWCLDYYKEFGAAPKAHIQDIFEAHKREYLDEDAADLVESLLSDLNDELLDAAQFNEQYVSEQAEKYIKSRKAQMLCEDVQALLSKGQVLEAEGRLANYSIPKRPAAEGDDVFIKDFWLEEEEQADILFKFPGALNDLIGPIERDSFISFLAPEKRGKTWWLLYTALTAFRQRCNVVFFSCGDMTKPQMRKRIRHMLTGRDPKRPKNEILLPVLDCWHNQMGDCPLEEETDPVILKGKKGKSLGDYDDFPDHVTCTKCYKDRHSQTIFYGMPWHSKVKLEDIEKPLDEACEAILKRSGNRRFKLYCYPPAELNVAQISAQLDILEQQEGFLADLIVIDYADLLDVEPSARKLEYRHQINASWMAMRALSQKRRCAIVTATQAKIETRKKSQVDQWDTSEDKRKLAHVTAMLALNQTPAEKRQGLMRISNIAMRDDDFDVERNVGVLQCLAIGKPCIISYPYKYGSRVAEEERRNKNDRG